MIIIIFDEETNKYNLLLLFGSLFSVYIQWFLCVWARNQCNGFEFGRKSECDAHILPYNTRLIVSIWAYIIPKVVIVCEQLFGRREKKIHFSIKNNKMNELTQHEQCVGFCYQSAYCNRYTVTVKHICRLTLTTQLLLRLFPPLEEDSFCISPVTWFTSSLA